MAEGFLRSAGELTAIRGRSRPALDRWVTPGVPCPPFARWERLNRTVPGYTGPGWPAWRAVHGSWPVRRSGHADQGAVGIAAIGGKVLRRPARGVSRGGGSIGPDGARPASRQRRAALAAGGTDSGPKVWPGPVPRGILSRRSR